MSFAELWDADVFEDEINRPTPGSLLDHLGE